jgi:hypothetical protein
VSRRSEIFGHSNAQVFLEDLMQAETDCLQVALTGLPNLEDVRREESQAFDRIADDATELVIFGCAHRGEAALTAARNGGLKVVAFADNDAARQGQVLAGIPILSPKQAVDQYNDRAAFLITVYNSSAPMQQLQELGCKRIVPYKIFVWRFFDSIPSPKRFQLPHCVLEQTDDVRRGYGLLGDNKSQKEFAAQIRWRCSSDAACLVPPDSPSEL